MKKPVAFAMAAWTGLAALVSAAGMWLFVERVLIPHQIADAAALGRPRGNLSDLYPRWVGARELLLEGRDPYSLEVTHEIQTGYYGRTLHPTRPQEPGDVQGFAYPVYVVFYLAPTIRLPFAIVQKAFFWILLIVIAASVPIWLRALQWPLGMAAQFSLIVFALGSLPAVQGLKLEQITLLVSGLVAIAILLLIKGHAAQAGVFLALATVKPQLVVLLLLWLALWTLGDLRRRYVWLVSFLLTMAILFGASEFYLPHWIPRFWQAIRDYQRYTGAMAVMEKLTGSFAGRGLEILAVLVMLLVCWRERKVTAGSISFAFQASLVLAITVLVVPTFAPYNQVLLVPALLVMIKERHPIWQDGAASKLLFAVTACLILWPWVASIGLVFLSFGLPRETVEGGWALPFWTSLLIPVAVAAEMLVLAGRPTFATSRAPATS